MKIKMVKYLKNCFWLFLPVFIWNIVLASKLPIKYSPEFFDNNIPNYISYSENILRAILFSFPVIMIFSLKSKIQKLGFGLYLVGIIIYFASWLVQIYYPSSFWSESILGFTAPAYTTIIYFIGIGLIGKQTFLKTRYVSFSYILLSICFVIIHSIHTYMGFN